MMKLIMLIDERVSKTCPSGYRYFSSIDECVSSSIASLPVFSNALIATHSCIGGSIKTVHQLEALRTCDTVMGSLTIEIYDISADFTSLYDINVIEGMSLSLI